MGRARAKLDQRQEPSEPRSVALDGGRGSHRGLLDTQFPLCSHQKKIWRAEYQGLALWEKLHCFMGAYKRITTVATTAAKPFIYDVTHNCQLKQIQIP
jgi:hypothetical protein